MFVRSIGFAAAVLAFVTPCLAGTQTRVSAFEYDPATGLLTKEIIEPLRIGDPNAPNYYPFCLATTYQYDAFGNKISSPTRNCDGTAPNEAPAPTGDAVIATRTSYAGFGPSADPHTNGTDAQYRFPTRSENALGHVETKQFDARFGTVTSLIGPNNLTTTWTYDSFGRKVSETRADGTVTNWFYERCVDLNLNTCPAFGEYRVRVTATGAPTSSIYYDSLNREIQAETQGFDGTLVRKDTQYDSLGRIAQVSRPYYVGATPVWTVFTLYDILGRVKQVDEPGQARTVTDYNGLVTTVTVSNAGSGAGLPGDVTQTRTTTKNSQFQVVQVQDTQGNIISYTYDEFGNLKTTTDALGNVTALGYDLRGRKTLMFDPDMGTWQYFYNALGELIRQTDAKGQTASMSYDPLGRMTVRVEPDLISAWTYDSCTKGIGKLCQASATNGYARTHVYDSLGRAITLNVSMDTVYTVNTTYVQSGIHVGKVDTLTYPTGFRVRHCYNDFGYPKEVRANPTGNPPCETDGTLLWHANARSASGLVTSELLGNKLTQTKTLDVLDRLSTVVASGTAGTVQSVSYTYDAIGNVTDRVDNANTVTEHFAYDKLNRLKMASGTGPSGPSDPLVTRSFDYDAIGNLIYKSDVSPSVPGGTYSYPASGAGSARPHAVSSITGTVNGISNPSFTYDANGNLTSGGGGVLAYTSFNLPSVIASSNATYQYAYTPEHERGLLITQLATGTQTSIYLHPGGAGSLLYEKEIMPDHTEHKHYVQAGSILVGVYVTKSVYTGGDGPQMRYYHRDHLGSIVAITNESGAPIETLAYEAYGKRRFPNGTADPNNSLFGITTDRGFTAHEHLDEMGLIHMNGRIYSPLLGRFLTPDPFLQSPRNLQSYNRYSYVLNNPLAYTDPSGYSWWTDIRGVLIPVAAIAAAIVVPELIGTQFAIAADGISNTFVVIEMESTTLTGLGSALAGAAGGFTAGVIAGGDLRSGLNGAVGGALFGFAGTIGGDTDFSRYAAHAGAGCVQGALGGGGCGRGAASAVAAKYVTNATTEWDRQYQFAAAVVAGGTVSVVGGGKFANGAVTAAFGYLFNACGATSSDCWDNLKETASDLWQRLTAPTPFCAEQGCVTGTPPLASVAGGAGLANRIGMLREASSKIGNFSVGTVDSIAEADALGRAWVGPGYRVSDSGRAWLSVDGTKIYRPATFKPTWGESQANFMRIDTQTGRALSNAHLTVRP